jgi:hypothetical protein
MGGDILQKEGGGRCDHKAPKKAWSYNQIFETWHLYYKKISFILYYSNYIHIDFSCNFGSFKKIWLKFPKHLFNLFLFKLPRWDFDLNIY